MDLRHWVLLACSLEIPPPPPRSQQHRVCRRQPLVLSASVAAATEAVSAAEVALLWRFPGRGCVLRWLHCSYDRWPRLGQRGRRGGRAPERWMEICRCGGSTPFFLKHRRGGIQVKWMSKSWIFEGVELKKMTIRRKLLWILYCICYINIFIPPICQRDTNVIWGLDCGHGRKRLCRYLHLYYYINIEFWTIWNKLPEFLKIKTGLPQLGLRYK